MTVPSGTVTTTQSQATPATSPVVYQASQVNQDLSTNASTAVASTPTTQPGVAAANDNNTPSSNNTANAQPTTGTGSFSQPITPQANILDKYTSYTYSLSWYLLTPQQAAELSTLGTQNISSWQLLIQSGGIPVGSRYSLDPNNQIFSKDFYMDNLEIKSVLSGRGTNSAHNATEMSWTVTEPNGLTLLNNIYGAVVNLYKQNSIAENPNYVMANYVMVIKFYGYDENGNLVKVGKQGTNGVVNQTDPSAVVTKFYPIRITNISFQLTNKQVEYKVEAVPVPYNINRGTFRATIPYNYELVGNNLKDIFVGKAPSTANATASTTQPVTIPTAPSNASDAPSGSTNNVFTGLCEALNNHQQQLVALGTYEVADTYTIEFASSDLANATVKKPGNTDYSATPMQQSKTEAGKLNPDTNSVESQGRTVPVLAGKQIVQFLEEQIRASSYISNQLTYTTSEVTGQQVASKSNSQQPTTWYKINFVATPGKYDNKRRDFAYNIKYIISPFAVTTMQSEYAPDGKFRGVHKSYNYWFTGQNTQVLNYSQSINSLYAVVMSGKQAFNAQKVTGRDQVARTYMAASGQSSQGADKAANEPGANLADYLYSFADLATINIKIVGDPAWLQQGEAAGVVTKNINLNPFNNDGTINFDASQIAFDVTWNTPVDYNMQTGLMEVNGPATKNEHATYQATECKSTFNRGRFEQDLVGSLIPQQVTQNSMSNAAAATGSSSTSTVDGGSTGTTGNVATTSAGPLTAAAAAQQLGLPNLGNFNLGNTLANVGNYIRNPLQNILPEGRITGPAPNSNLGNPVAPLADSAILPANNGNVAVVSNGSTVTATPPNGVQVFDARTGTLVVTGSAVTPTAPQKIVKEP